MKNCKMFPVGRVVDYRGSGPAGLPAIYPHILGCLALRVTFLSPGAAESSLHAPLPKEFIRANGIVSPMEGIPYVKI